MVLAHAQSVRCGRKCCEWFDVVVRVREGAALSYKKERQESIKRIKGRTSGAERKAPLALSHSAQSRIRPALLQPHFLCVIFHPFFIPPPGATACFIIPLTIIFPDSFFSPRVAHAAVNPPSLPPSISFLFHPLAKKITAVNDTSWRAYFLC